MKLRILAEATAELRDAMRYYEQRQSGLGALSRHSPTNSAEGG